MINKVAIAQCIRDAFPADYEGLYSEDELVASGVINIEDTGNTVVIDTDGVVVQDTVAAVIEEPDRKVTKEERQALFTLVQEVYGKENGNAKLKQFLEEAGIASTTELMKSDYDNLVERINGDRNSGDNNEE